VVDLDVVARVLSALEGDRRAGVEVVQRAGRDVAPVCGERDVDQVPDEDLLPGA
jgi:hypothetical protein